MKYIKKLSTNENYVEYEVQLTDGGLAISQEFKRKDGRLISFPKLMTIETQEEINALIEMLWANIIPNRKGKL